MDHPFVQYLILLLAIVAGIVALKAGAAYLPESAPFGGMKKVLLAI